MQYTIFLYGEKKGTQFFAALFFSSPLSTMMWMDSYKKDDHGEKRARERRKYLGSVPIYKNTRLPWSQTENQWVAEQSLVILCSGTLPTNLTKWKITGNLYKPSYIYDIT